MTLLEIVILAFMAALVVGSAITVTVLLYKGISLGEGYSRLRAMREQAIIRGEFYKATGAILHETVRHQSSNMDNAHRQ